MLDNTIGNVIWCVDDHPKNLILKPLEDGDVGVSGLNRKIPGGGKVVCFQYCIEDERYYFEAFW